MTRTAADIGAGLASARPARPIGRGERIHVVGAAGAGASAAALLAHAAGAAVTGCDPGGPSQYTPALESVGIQPDWQHDPSHVTREPRPDRLAVTKALTSIAPDHPELAAARSAGIPLEPWQQTVADAAAGRRLVAVAGTHGKSTSAGWLTHALVAAGFDPGAFVGALLPSGDTGSLPATARTGRGDAFVVEADEYAGNFDPYHPAIAVMTTAEWDHPDVFEDRNDVVAVFEAWLRAAADERPPSSPPVLVANVADEGVAELCARLRGRWPGTIVPTAIVDTSRQRLDGYARGLGDEFGVVQPEEASHARAGPARAGAKGGGAERPAQRRPAVLVGRIEALDAGGTTVELFSRALLGEPMTVRLPTAGRHNAANALGVAAAARLLGVPVASLAAGLASFTGVGRRLERKGEGRGVVVYDDYGHHPSAIRETLLAVRQREPGAKRIWAVYEPLTFHRTAALLDAFADVLARADAVAIADIWAGRDPDRTIASPAGLAAAVAARNPSIPVATPGSVEATAAWLAHEVRPGDAVLVMGGGRSYRIAELLVDALRGAF